jgi:hypothetical protein
MKNFHLFSSLGAWRRAFFIFVFIYLSGMRHDEAPMESGGKPRALRNLAEVGNSFEKSGGVGRRMSYPLSESRARKENYEYAKR